MPTSIRSLRIISGIGLFGGILLPMAVLTLERNFFTIVLAWLGWFCWALIAITGPAISLRQGKVETPGAMTDRAKTPVLFWVRLIALETLTLFFLFLASLALYAYLHPISA
jgi:hypothetical protein